MYFCQFVQVAASKEKGCAQHDNILHVLCKAMHLAVGVSNQDLFLDLFCDIWYRLKVDFYKQ
jgi:hypothetical protein